MIKPLSASMSEKLQFKKNAILRTIRRQGPMGRLDVSRAVQISNSRVCDLVGEMLEDGMLLEDHNGEDRRGRRGVPVRVNPDYGVVIGFDMEALRIRLVACDFAGQLVWQKQQKLGKVTSRAKLLDRLMDCIADGIDEFGRNRKILGIGLAAAGVTDTRRGVILHYDMLEAARDLPLRDLVATQTGLPCRMEDNINALAVAEWMSGAAQGLSDFICLAVRSGVGAGLFLNGRLHTGFRGLAGEAGYTIVPRQRASSQWKFLQNIVSEQALGVDLDKADHSLSPPRAARAGELLGAQLASMAALLDPQAIILAGELIQPTGPLYDAMIRSLRRFLLPELADSLQLLPAQLGPYAAAIGAAHRCFQSLYPIDQQPTETHP